MKRRLITFIATIMAVCIAVGSLSACNLITTDNERDMNQVVATVSIEDGVKDEILKKELIMAYLNYGYVYTQYYGYTQEQTFNAIIDNLIANKIIAQTAMKALNEQGKVEDSSKGKWEVERYLTEEEILDAKYQTRKTINDLLHSYENEETLKQDSLLEAVRTVPTNAANKEKEIEQYKGDGYEFDINSTTDRRKAFNSFVDLLDSNGLLGEDFDGTVESTAYYKELLASNYENALVEKFENVIKSAKRSEYTLAKLNEEFLSKVNEQKQFDNKEFVDAITNASMSSPVLYSAYGTYGYVYNLLLGASEKQTESIGKITEDNKNISDGEYSEARREILADTEIKDLRSSWILSGYDFDYATKKFTGDYTFAKDGANSLPFQGTVTEFKAPTATENGSYGVSDLTKFTLDEFIEFMNEYVYGASYKTADVKENSGDVYSKLNGNGITVSEYDAKINELLFAFSTDSGSLNTYKGYVIKPEVDGKDSEQYVKTFADAGRELLTMGNNSYIIVASDYGYHVMFFSEVFKETDLQLYADLSAYLDANFDKGSYTGWTDYLNAMIGNFDKWEDTDNYLYLLLNEVSSAKVSNYLAKVENDIINDALYENDYVVKYEKAYSDLLGE